MTVPYSSLLRRLIGSFVLILSPFFALSAVMNYAGMETLRDEAYASMEAQVSYYLESLESEIARIRKLQTDLITDRDINQLAAIPQSLDNIDRVFALLRVQKRMYAVKESSDYVRNVFVMMSGVGKTVSPTEVSDLDGEDFERFKRLAETSGDVAYDEGGMFLVMRYPPAYLSGERAALFIIVVELSLERFSEALEAIRGETGTVALVRTDGSGATIASATIASARIASATVAGTTVAGAAEAAGVEKEQRYLSVGKSSSYLGASLVKRVPERALFRRVHRYGAWLYVLIVAALFIIFAYSVNLYRFIHKPLKRLAAAFMEVEKGDFRIHIDHTREDEFRYIYGQFNRMVVNLGNLIDQVYKEKLLVREAETRQLQSQINPHFLYNSFFMLNTMIRTGDTENLEKITEGLGKYFRYITKNDSGTASLEDETRHGRIYAEIQALRFRNRVSIRFDPLPDGWKDVVVPRLILQPIVENAFAHGLREEDGTGNVDVRFVENGSTLAVVVESSGRVLDDAAFDAIRAKLTASDSLGECTALTNIHRRLLFKYGPGGGLAVERGAAGGLRVVIRLPAEER